MVLKNFVKRVLKIIAWILSLFYSYQFFRKFSYLRNAVYSYSIKRIFKSCGENFHVEFPAQIIGSKYISIGRDFCSFARLRIEAHDNHNNVKFEPVLTIGNNFSINFDCHIACCNEVIIGDNVLLASRVFITDHFHGQTKHQDWSIAPNKRILYSSGPVVIEEGVWVGEGACILPNVTIGANSIVGANAVVTKSFPKNSIIGGIPAKIIRRNEEI